MEIAGVILLIIGVIAIVTAIYSFIVNAGDAPDAPIDQMGRSITFNNLWFIASVCGVSGLAIILSWRWWMAVIGILACHATTTLVQSGLDWCLWHIFRRSDR